MSELIDRWTGGFRLTLWLSNPNDTAAFLALLIGLLVYLTMARSRWVVGLAYALVFVAACLLGLTASRGGLLSLLVGLLSGLAVCAWHRRWMDCVRFTAIGLVVLVAAFWTGGALRDRTAQMVGGEDGSTEARFLIYNEVPAMLMAAPGGWGWGRSADAYMQWFQPVSDLRVYRNLTRISPGWWRVVSSSAFFISLHGFFSFRYVCPPAGSKTELFEKLRHARSQA